MLESDARAKMCPIMSRKENPVLCQGSDCVFWSGSATTQIAPATQRAQFDAQGWSTNSEVAEDGTMVFYRAPSGDCSQAQRS